MTMLDDDMKSTVARTMLSFVATTNPDGGPNVSPKSSLRVLDDRHLLFANIASPATLRNLQNDPRVEINCVDIFLRKGYRFKGCATIHAAGDAVFEDLAVSVKAEHGDHIPVHHAVRVEVLQARPLLSPAYMFGEGASEEAVHRLYLQKYGVEKRPAQEQ